MSNNILHNNSCVLGEADLLDDLVRSEQQVEAEHDLSIAKNYVYHDTSSPFNFRCVEIAGIRKISFSGREQKQNALTERMSNTSASRNNKLEQESRRQSTQQLPPTSSIISTANTSVWTTNSQFENRQRPLEPIVTQVCFLFQFNSMQLFIFI